jgi:integrase
MKFTVKSIAGLALASGKKDQIEFDDAIPGFGLRLREGGSRTWVFQYTRGAKQRRIVIGRESALPLGKARDIAADLHAKVRLGGDPAAEKAANNAAAALTFKAVADRFLMRQKARVRPRSYVEAERYIGQYAKPLHGMPIASIDQRAVAARLSDITDTKGAMSANRMRGALSALFTWAMKEGLATHNPVISTNKHTERSRDRVLADDELAAIWRACRDDDYGQIIKLLMLTGQRLTEISELRWSEIDLDKGLIELPAARTKNKRPHQIPMSSVVIGILEARQKPEGRDLVFGYGDRSFGGWSFAKRMLDQRIAVAEKPLPPWTTHDLRRTCATRTAELGVQPHIVEAVLTMSAATRPG